MYKLINEHAVKFSWKIPHEVGGNHPSSLKPRLCTYVPQFYMPDICWPLSISYCSAKIGYHRPAALRVSGTVVPGRELCLGADNYMELTDTFCRWRILQYYPTYQGNQEKGYGQFKKITKKFPISGFMFFRFFSTHGLPLKRHYVGKPNFIFIINETTHTLK